MEQQSALGTRKILPLVISMSVPMAFTMLINSLYNIVDGYFVARISEDAMTAVSLVFPLQYTTTAIAVGTGVGVNAAVAFYMGAGDQERADGAASLGVLLSVLHTILLMVIIPLVARPFLGAFTDNTEIIEYGIRYLNIVIFFTFFVEVAICYEKIFQAVGNMKVAVVCLSSGCIANIILDPMMIFGFGPIPAMGIDGAAWATGIGQALTLALYAVYIAKGELPLQMSIGKGWQWKSLAGRVYTVGIPSAMSLSLQSVMVALLNVVLAGLSANGVFIMGVYYKLQSFIYLTSGGIVQGIRPIVAYNYGAGDQGRVREVYRTAQWLSIIVMCVGTVLCLLLPEWMFGMFTTNPETVAAGAAALRIICIGYPISALSVVAAGMLEGLGIGIWSFVISFTRLVAFLVPIAYAVSRILAVQGVWVAFPITEFLAAGLALALYRKGFRRAFMI